MAKKSLKEHIKSQGRMIVWVAEKIGMSQPLLSQKLNGSGQARLDEDTVDAIVKLLGINKEDVL